MTIPPNQSDNNKGSDDTSAEFAIPTLPELLSADPDQFVAKYTDIAAVNLACARGLPKADDAEFPGYLPLLDTMADAVRRQTERSWRLFKIKPAEFHHSENVFRIFTMEHVLRVQFGVKYDPLVSKLTSHGKNNAGWNTIDSSEIFIHGVLSEKRTGTCSSLPTFSIAVGRRLGYPLKLVRVPNHTLFRWDDGREIFNLQHADTGGDIRPDEYFYKWPRAWDEIDHQINARTKVWLHSMTPRQEVSKFLCNRAILLREARRFQEAFQALEAAARFDPVNPAPPEIRSFMEQQLGGRVDVSLLMTQFQKSFEFGGNLPPGVLHQRNPSYPKHPFSYNVTAPKYVAFPTAPIIKNGQPLPLQNIFHPNPPKKEHPQ